MARLVLYVPGGGFRVGAVSFGKHYADRPVDCQNDSTLVFPHKQLFLAGADGLTGMDYGGAGTGRSFADSAGSQERKHSDPFPWDLDRAGLADRGIGIIDDFSRQRHI